MSCNSSEAFLSRLATDEPNHQQIQENPVFEEDPDAAAASPIHGDDPEQWNQLSQLVDKSPQALTSTGFRQRRPRLVHLKIVGPGLNAMLF